MDISVFLDGDMVWSLNSGATPCIFTGDACQSDETKQRIIGALAEALDQAQGQLGCLEIADAVFDVCSTPAQVDRYIPIIVVRDDDSSGEHTEKTSVSSVFAAGAKGLKVGIVCKSHVALVTALHDDDVATV